MKHQMQTPRWHHAGFVTWFHRQITRVRRLSEASYPSSKLTKSNENFTAIEALRIAQYASPERVGVQCDTRLLSNALNHSRPFGIR
jgi:hypothetical protein